MPDPAAAERPAARAESNPYVAAILAWLVPGAGHLLLGRRARGFAFLVIVLVTLWVGTRYDGNLYHVVPNQPLTLLATFACMGLGAPYFLLRFGIHYQGDILSAGYEYGTAFVLTAGLMNLLLVLDAWDIATGRKD